MDLDDEELAATRVMHGLDKKDGSDTNVGSIEEDIKILENLKSYLNLLVYEGKDKIIYNDLFWDEKTVDCIIAIEHLLRDYTRQKQINKEHQKINGELREKVKQYEEIIEDYQRMYCGVVNDNIPKQKIIDFKEKIKLEPVIVGGRRNKKTLEYGIKLGKIKACEELLGESEETNGKI